MRVVQFPDYRKDNSYQQLLADALREESIETVFPTGYRRGLPFSRALLPMRSVDVLHLHWLTPYLKGATGVVKGLYAGKLLLDCMLIKARGIRLVWTVHNLVSHDTTTPRLEITLSRILARLADRLIVHSDGARDTVAQQFRVSLEKISIIPHGSYAGVYGSPMPRLEARVRLGLDLEVPVFLFFGMIRPYKGVTDLLEVWNAAPELHKNALLIIAGDARDPALTATIRGLAEQAPNVQLHMRFIADEEVPLFFGAADWLVLPFARSLTSGSAMLAQAYGRPVVASNVEGLQPDVAGRPEEVFEANDREALRGALARACKRTAASRQDACETVDNKDYRRDWAEIADQHAAAYGLAPVTSSKAA